MREILKICHVKQINVIISLMLIACNHKGIKTNNSISRIVYITGVLKIDNSKYLFNSNSDSKNHSVKYKNQV